MKNFKFKYESILNLIENKESNTKNNLGVAYDRLNETKAELHTLIYTDSKWSQEIKENLNSGCKLLLLKNIYGYKHQLNKKINEQNEKIKDLENEIHSIKKELLEISKEKKIMEKLKEKELDKYKLNIKNVEEKLIDQLVTYSNRLRR